MYDLSMSLPRHSFSRRFHSIIQGFTSAESGNSFDRMHLISHNAAETSRDADPDANTLTINAASAHMTSVQMAMIGLQQRRTMSILVGIRDRVGPCATEESPLETAPPSAAAAATSLVQPSSAHHEIPAPEDSVNDDARRQRVLASVARRAAAREFLEATLQGVPDVRVQATPVAAPHSAAHQHVARSTMSSPP